MLTLPPLWPYASSAGVAIYPGGFIYSPCPHRVYSSGETNGEKYVKLMSEEAGAEKQEVCERRGGNLTGE